uniref:Odorant binding protein 8 n=1 Tax=Chrysopa pallens TaxID=417485 RepID=A0A0R8P2R2_CHRPA|nr:odorant binding protein 8 [Chrysopa pallens]
MFPASVLTLLLVSIGFTIAYDFSDNAFNNYLYEQINLATEDQQVLKTFSRSRRGLEHHIAEKCSFHSKINCCGETEADYSDEHNAVKAKCFAEHFPKSEEHKHDPFSCENIKAMKQKVACAMNCIAESYNLIENGEPKSDALKSMMESWVTEDWQKALIGPVIEKCIPIAKDFAAEHPAEDGGCSVLPIKLFHCMWRTWQLECPADKVQTNAVCTKIMKILKENTH